MGIVRTNIRQLVPTAILGLGCSVLVFHYTSDRFSLSTASLGGLVSAILWAGVLCQQTAYIYRTVGDRIENRWKEIPPGDHSTAGEIAAEVAALPVPSWYWSFKFSQ